MKSEKSKKIDDLRGMLLGLEMNLRILEDDLDVISKTLVYLDKIEQDLIYNINLHRKPKIISIVTEYRRSIIELQQVRKEISKHRNIKLNLERKMKQQLDSYDYYINELEVAYNDLNSEPVILLFRKDRKNVEKN